MLGYVTCVLGPMPRSACRDRYHLWWRAWFLLVDELLVVYSGTIVPTTCQTRVYSKRVMTLHLPRMGRIVLLYLVAASLPLALQGQQVVNATTGNPLVDGPGPYKRLPARPLDRSRPLVIGHRGDSGEFPEHSELAYRAAINHGAQFIECCDVVLTADLVPVCRHEPLISNTTNADDLFPTKVRSYIIDGANSTGVHAIDLTLEELKRVRVRQRLYTRSQAFDDFLPVMTFEECATMARNFYTSEGIVVGIYPETKHPTWHDSLVAERWPYILSTYQGNLSSRAGQWQALQGRQGSQGSGSTSQDALQYDGSTQSKGTSEGSNSTGSMPPPPTITDIVLEVAHRLGYNNAIYSQGWNQQPIFLQSFEVNNLKYARNRTMIPIVQLTDDLFVPVPDQSYAKYSALLADMSGIASYAQGIGPYKATLLSNYNTSSGDIATGAAGDSGIVNRAHASGLQVHLYTLRNEPVFLPPFNSIDEEYTYYFKTLGVEGGFTDFPGTLVPWTRANGPWQRNLWVNV